MGPSFLLNLLALLIFLVIVFWIAKLAVAWLQGPPILLQIVGLVLLLWFLMALLGSWPMFPISHGGRWWGCP